MHVISEPKTGMSIRQMASRSTIYNRHEARRARTVSLKDDPRAPIVRVMSGLPIFNLIVPPFEPLHIIYASTELVGRTSTKSDEDICSRYSETKPASSSRMPSFLSIVLAAASGGILSEACLGKRSALAAPFASNHSQALYRQVVPIFHYEGAAALESIRSRTKIPTIRSSSVGGISAMHLAQSASLCFLFGSKAVVERLLIDHVAMTEPLTTVTAAAAAGLLQACSKTIIGKHVSFSREVSAVAVYFSAYEGVKHLISKDIHDRPSMFTVAIAGAMAGASSVYVRGNHSLVAVRSIPFAPASIQRLSLAALRASPYHALLFVGYETALSFFIL